MVAGEFSTKSGGEKGKSTVIERFFRFLLNFGDTSASCLASGSVSGYKSKQSHLFVLHAMLWGIAHVLSQDKTFDKISGSMSIYVCVCVCVCVCVYVCVCVSRRISTYVEIDMDILSIWT